MPESPPPAADSHEYYVGELKNLLDSISDLSAKEEMLQACKNHVRELLTEQQIDAAYHPVLHHNQVRALQDAAKPLSDDVNKIRSKYPDLSQQFGDLYQLLFQCSQEVVQEVIGTTQTSEAKKDDDIRERVEKTLE